MLWSALLKGNAVLHRDAMYGWAGFALFSPRGSLTWTVM